MGFKLVVYREDPLMSTREASSDLPAKSPYTVYYLRTRRGTRYYTMAEKNKLDLDKIHKDVAEKINASTTDLDISLSTDKFNALLDTYDRYLDGKQRELRERKVATKEIVADEDAVKETLKTFYAINKKLQQQIEDGAELSKNDIQLLVSMMQVLNGGS